MDNTEGAAEKEQRNTLTISTTQVILVMISHHGKVMEIIQQP